MVAQNGPLIIRAAGHARDRDYFYIIHANHIADSVLEIEADIFARHFALVGTRGNMAVDRPRPAQRYG